MPSVIALREYRRVPLKKAETHRGRSCGFAHAGLDVCFGSPFHGRCPWPGYDALAGLNVVRSVANNNGMAIPGVQADRMLFFQGSETLRHVRTKRDACDQCEMMP